MRILNSLACYIYLACYIELVIFRLVFRLLFFSLPLSTVKTFDSGDSNF